jgi:hypothetical protein
MNYITTEQAAALATKYALPQGLGKPHWPVIFNEVIKHYLEAQPAKPTQLTDEQDQALWEAYSNEAADQYFKARPQHDDIGNRSIYCSGHRKAWLTKAAKERT